MLSESRGWGGPWDDDGVPPVGGVGPDWWRPPLSLAEPFGEPLRSSGASSHFAARSWNSPDGRCGLGLSRRGQVSSDGLRFGSTPNAALSKQGVVWQGTSRPGRARLGTTRLVAARVFCTDGLLLGSIPSGALRLGSAPRGAVGQGSARQGLSSQGMGFCLHGGRSWRFMC